MDMQCSRYTVCDGRLVCCRPEFLNRLDEIIVFRQLSKGEVKEIADIMLKEVFVRAEEKGIKIDVTERFKVSWQTRAKRTPPPTLPPAFYSIFLVPARISRAPCVSGN